MCGTARAHRELDAIVVGREGEQQLARVVEAVVVGEDRVVHVRLLGHHLDNRVAEERRARVARVQEGEAKVSARPRARSAFAGYSLGSLEAWLYIRRGMARGSVCGTSMA